MACLGDFVLVEDLERYKRSVGEKVSVGQR